MSAAGKPGRSKPGLPGGQARRSASSAAACLACAALCCATWPAHAELVPAPRNGLPQQVIPEYQETGAPTFVTRVAPPPPVVTPVSTDPGSGGDTGPDTSGTLAKMEAKPWGAQAEQNAAALGVNPVALAATCSIESNCTANPGGSGTISGAFQMRDDTFRAMADEAIARNPSLASQILPGLASKNDPAAQAIASSQYLYDGAVKLQAAGVSDPNFSQVRPMFQFGLSGGLRLGTADDSTLLSSQVSLTPAQWKANGLDPATATVGQYRQMTASKVGGAAGASVLS